MIFVRVVTRDLFDMNRSGRLTTNGKEDAHRLRGSRLMNSPSKPQKKKTERFGEIREK